MSLSVSSNAGQMTNHLGVPCFRLYLAIVTSKFQFLVYNGIKTFFKQLNQLSIYEKMSKGLEFLAFQYICQLLVLKSYCCYQDHGSSYLIASMHAKLSTFVLAKRGNK